MLKSSQSVDMATISGPDSESALTFVKNKDSQQFDHLLSKHQEPYMTNAYPKLYNDQDVIELKKYLNSNPVVSQILGKSPNLTVDQNLDQDTLNTISDLESQLESITSSNSIKGLILLSSLQQIDSAVNTAFKFKLFKQAQSKNLTKKDDRLFNLIKLIINNSNK